MKNYFVIVLDEKNYYQYKLSDIIANSFNGIVSEEYAYKGIRFYFPIVFEDDSYFIVDRNSGWNFVINGDVLKDKEKKELQSGDYIVVKNESVTLTMMVLSYDKCVLSSSIYELDNGGTYFIGRLPEMNIVIDTSPSVSRKHAAIRVENGGSTYIDDLSGKTGVYVNGVRIFNKKLESGDHIFIMGATMVFYNGYIIVPDSFNVNGMSKKEKVDTIVPGSNNVMGLFVRTPRIRKTLDKIVIEIDPPTTSQKTKEMPFILMAGPSLTMALAMMASLGVAISNVVKGGNATSLITSAVMAISMLLGALLWPKLMRDYNKRQAEANEELRQKRYREYLKEKEEQILHSYNRNTRIWNEYLFPEAKELIKNAKEQNRHLWERTIHDEDFLEIRLGSGSRPFEVGLSISKKGFELEPDSLKEEGYSLVEKYSELKGVPITLSIKEHRVVGVIGDYAEIAKTIITNLTTLYSPDEIKIVLVYNSFRNNELLKYNDLPHMWSSDRSKRYVATSVDEAYLLFSEMDEIIETREETLTERDIRIPHFVVLSFDKTIIDSTSFKKTLVDSNNSLGISTIFFGERFNQIPKECDTIIQKNNEICGLYIKDENDNRLREFKPDAISDRDVDELIKSLSQIEMKIERTSTDVPDRISFLDVFQVGNIDELNIASHWNTNASDKTLATPIGVMAGGKQFYLDIHEKYHGCHGLVAGTTGSGKSEFLQAYILSMMINYSPNEVAFVLVDFKGGDMARPFLASPHLSATISNLSGNTLYRALVSLEAEVQNRQRIFNESAALLEKDKIDINSYHKYYKEGKLEKPLPHLVIVIDEFAQLKSQHPEFMQKLVDIAQVGRSLGIHLILATQKPSGVVDPQIWSNARFKVCLKVMDKQDSSDMIGRPVAAMIKNPGRAYVQVGYDEIFELIQSGYSGADYIPHDSYIDEDSITVSMVNWPGEEIREAKDIIRGERTEDSQLEAVMEQIVNIGKLTKVHADKLWLDPLPNKLLLQSIHVKNDNAEKIGMVTLGVMDLPHIQEQRAFTYDFVHDGHLAIYGSTGTGKSTTIQSIFYAMAYNYTPEMFHSMIIDFSGGSLLNLSHTANCIKYVNDENETDVMSLLNTISSIISDRRKQFNDLNVGNYEAYIAAGYRDIPIILVAIDNYASFREKMYGCEDVLVQNIASAGSCGIYFVITGTSKGAIYYKVTDHIKKKIVLNLNDTNGYRDILDSRIPIIPENYKGRGLIIYDKIVVEMQVGVPFNADSDSERMNKINAFYEDQFIKYGQVDSFVKGDKPETKYDSEYVEEYKPTYKHIETKYIRTFESVNAIFNVTNQRTGESIGIFNKNENTKVFIANTDNNPFILSEVCRQLDEQGIIYKVYSKEVICDSIPSNRLIEDINEFAVEYRNGDDDIAFVINGFSDLYDEILDNALTLLEIAVEKKSHRLVVTIDTMDRIGMYYSTQLYQLLVRCKAGLISGGKITEEKAMLLSDGFNMSYDESNNRELGDGVAIAYEGDAIDHVIFGGIR